MRITLLTYGSRGDVQPFTALAQGLQSAGHKVRLAAPARFARLAEAYGVPFAPLPGDPQELSVRLNAARRSTWRLVSSLTDFVLAAARPVWLSAKAACQEAELIVHSFLFTAGAHSLARGLGIPDVSVQLFPMFAATRRFPPVGWARLPSGCLSYAAHRFAAQVAWQVNRAGFARLRRADPQTFNLQLSWPWAEDTPTPSPLIMAHSPSLLPRPADWTQNYVHVPGYFFLDAPFGWQPPDELQRFLDDGPPPVCVTFGSMINQDGARIQALVRRAVERLGLRAVLLQGWGGGAQPPAPSCLSLPAAPHDWLLPRCRAVIHHGGAGTTAAGLRAGIPNLILPHGGDQPFWGRCVAQAGAGPQPLSLERLSEAALVEALAQAGKPEMQAKAAALGRAIRSEDGVGKAVQIIETHARSWTG